MRCSQPIRHQSARCQLDRHSRANGVLTAAFELAALTALSHCASVDRAADTGMGRRSLTVARYLRSAKSWLSGC